MNCHHITDCAVANAFDALGIAIFVAGLCRISLLQKHPPFRCHRDLLFGYELKPDFP